MDVVKHLIDINILNKEETTNGKMEMHSLQLCS